MAVILTPVLSVAVPTSLVMAVSEVASARVPTVPSLATLACLTVYSPVVKVVVMDEVNGEEVEE